MPLRQSPLMPAENLGAPHEAYVTLAFTHGAQRRRGLIPRVGVADRQHPAGVRDDKAAAVVRSDVPRRHAPAPRPAPIALPGFNPTPRLSLAARIALGTKTRRQRLRLFSANPGS